MRHSSGGVAAVAMACAISVLVPTSVSGFGTWNAIGQKGEHERITRTLACGAADNQGGFCLQPHSLDQIAGEDGYLGGVGQPDSIPETLTGPGSKHCDDGDFLEGPYPRSRAQATAILKECVDRFQAYLGQAVLQAGNLVGADGKLNIREAALDQKGRGIDNCDIYDSAAGERPSARAKCAVFANLGRAAHIAQDFWSHSNWGDRAAPAPVSTSNPPGLDRKESPDFLRFPMPSITVPPLLATGCDDTIRSSRCTDRVFHGTKTGLNKDKGVIDPRTGMATVPATSRGQLYGGANFQAAVTGARMQTRLLYHDFIIGTRMQYGSDRAAGIQRAMSLDAPWTTCKQVGGAGKGAFRAPSKLPAGFTDRSVIGKVVNRTGVTPDCVSAILGSGEGWGNLPTRPGDLDFSAFGEPGGTSGSITFSFPSLGGNVTLRWDNPFVGFSKYTCSATAGLSCSASTKTSGNHATAAYEITRSARSSSGARASAGEAPLLPHPARPAAARGPRAQQADAGGAPRGLNLDPCGEQLADVTEELGVLRDGIGCTRVLKKLQDALLTGINCPKGWEREPNFVVDGPAGEAAGLPPMHLCWTRDDKGDDDPAGRGRELRAFTYLPDALLD